MSIRRFPLILVLALIFCSVNIALAGDQIQDRTKDQDRLMDGTCQDDVIEGGDWEVIAGDSDRDRTHDRLKDGS